MIDWTDPACKITSNFTVQDAIMLHQWTRLASEIDGLDDTIKANLINTFLKLESLQTILKHPIRIHCGFRSADYNIVALREELALDVHTKGQAVDFDCHPRLTIRQTKALIRPHLEALNLRMEKDTDTWVHIDTREPGPSGREFTA